MSETIQIVTATTGLIGTLGGVLISYLSLRHAFRKDRHSIKLEMSKAMLVWPQVGTTKPKFTKDQLTFKVANIGAKEFTVVSLGIQIGRRSGGLYINQPFGTVTLPHKLKPDETCDFWTVYSKIVKDVKKRKIPLHSKIKIRGYVKDYLGNSIYSNSMSITLKETKRAKVLDWVKSKAKSLLTLVQP